MLNYLRSFGLHMADENNFREKKSVLQQRCYATLQAQHHINITARTDVVIGHFVRVLQLFATKYQSNLIGCNTLLLCKVLFHLTNCQAWLKSDL
jgi:hypothetical protein